MRLPRRVWLSKERSGIAAEGVGESVDSVARDPKRARPAGSEPLLLCPFHSMPPRLENHIETCAPAAVMKYARGQGNECTR